MPYPLNTLPFLFALFGFQMTSADFLKALYVIGAGPQGGNREWPKEVTEAFTAKCHECFLEGSLSQQVRPGVPFRGCSSGGARESAVACVISRRVLMMQRKEMFFFRLLCVPYRESRPIIIILFFLPISVSECTFF